MFIKKLNSSFGLRAIHSLILVAALAMSVTGSVLASHPEVSLPGSNFEIDTDANLKQDDASPSIDWASVMESRKADQPSGSQDDSFGQGTKEDTAVPTVVNGSIPPNKSDLLNFGVYLESTNGTKILHLFWHRVQEPSGTTNMDFEFNQSSTLSANGVTRVRTAGDLLIQYDLAQGGTNPILFVSRWVTSASAGGQTPAQACEASNSFPCWGKKANLTAAGDATGSINTSTIPAADSDGLGDVSPRTFGEASVDFSSIVGSGQCVSFGSVYLKSRSSDSFTAALKDFIAPVSTSVSNCGTIIIRKQTDPNGAAGSFSYSTTGGLTPSTFSLSDDGVQTYNNVLAGSYSVTEADPAPAFDFVNIVCTGGSTTTSGRTVNITLAADETVDCTYNNRQRGTIIIKKVTEPSPDPSDTSFSFTAGGGLSPTSFSLKNGEMQTFSNVVPGSGYSVAETVPANWELLSATCDNGSLVSNIDVGAGETVTCTFSNRQLKGAILVTKTRKHAASGPGDHPHPGVSFTVNGVTKITDANGQACFDGLSFGNYNVVETVPSGYVAGGDTTKSVTVDNNATCGDNPYAGETVSFSNMPLTNITVLVDSQVAGGTASTIDCVLASSSTGPNGDGSLTLNDLQPGTYTCTIVVDP